MEKKSRLTINVGYYKRFDDAELDAAISTVAQLPRTHHLRNYLEDLTAAGTPRQEIARRLITRMQIASIRKTLAVFGIKKGRIAVNAAWTNEQ